MSSHKTFVWILALVAYSQCFDVTPLAKSNNITDILLTVITSEYCDGDLPSLATQPKIKNCLNQMTKTKLKEIKANYKSVLVPCIDQSSTLFQSNKQTLEAARTETERNIKEEAAHPSIFTIFKLWMFQMTYYNRLDAVVNGIIIKNLGKFGISKDCEDNATKLLAEDLEQYCNTK